MVIHSRVPCLTLDHRYLYRQLVRRLSSLEFNKRHSLHARRLYWITGITPGR